jgi:hypothetical protein
MGEPDTGNADALADTRSSTLPSSTTRSLRLADPGCAEAIRALLGATLGEAPFRHAGASVPRLTLMSVALGVPLRLDLWPRLARVDVALGDCFFVLTGIDEVLLLPGVEVLFRRAEPRAFLFITPAGAVALKT